jgi:hypothetical protein
MVRAAGGDDMWRSVVVLGVLIGAATASANTPRTSWPCGNNEVKWVEEASPPLRKLYGKRKLLPTCTCQDEQCKQHQVIFHVVLADEATFSANLRFGYFSRTEADRQNRLVFRQGADAITAHLDKAYNWMDPPRGVLSVCPGYSYRPDCK